MTQAENKTLGFALGYLSRGYSLVPVAPNGKKAPAISEWKPFQSERPTENHLSKWYAPASGARGIALIHGAVSGNLDESGCSSFGSEVLDFDLASAYDEFLAACEAGGFDGVLKLCVHVKTPSGGMHVYYRYEYADPFAEPGERDGNQKLASVALYMTEAEREELIEENGCDTEEDFARLGWRYEKATDRFFTIKTKIETRGEGGYTLAPGSPGACHPSGRSYQVVPGSSFNRVPLLTKDERDGLVAIARSLNEYVKPETVRRAQVDEGVRRREARPGELKPGEDFNLRGDVLGLLVSEGWQVAGERGQTIDLVRPGKSVRAGMSGTLHAVGPNVFYSFSTSALPFENDTSYDAFAVYAILKTGGDFAQAARDLAAQGFGEKWEPAKRADKYAPNVSKHRIADGVGMGGKTVTLASGRVVAVVEGGAS